MHSVIDTLKLMMPLSHAVTAADTPMDKDTVMLLFSSLLRNSMPFLSTFLDKQLFHCSKVSTRRTEEDRKLVCNFQTIKEAVHHGVQAYDCANISWKKSRHIKEYIYIYIYICIYITL